MILNKTLETVIFQNRKTSATKKIIMNSVVEMAHSTGKVLVNKSDTSVGSQEPPC